MNRTTQLRPKRRDVLWRAIGESVLCLGPDELIRIEFWALPITETDPVAISEIEPPAEARLPTAFENNAGVVELVAADAAKTLSKCDGGRGSAGAAGHFCAYG